MNRRSRAVIAVAVAAAAAVAVLAGGGGCGGTSGTVLQHIDAATPPSSNLRMDVLFLRSVSSCAVGLPCTRPLSQCFTLDDAAGPGLAFEADNTLRFFPPGAPEITAGAQSGCFRIDLDDRQITAAHDVMADLAAEVFNASGGDVNIDLRFHDLAPVDVGFARWERTIFLPPSAVEPAGLTHVNRETDFAFAISGDRNADALAVVPRIEHCAGTDISDQGLFGGSPYTWTPTSDRCARLEPIFRGWMFQFAIAKRAFNGPPDLYASGSPPCGQGDPDPTLWFPRIDGCTSDPDWTACGQTVCPDLVAYYAHVIGKHWPRGRVFNGNYCSNGRTDPRETGETAIDTGGVCDLLGR